MTYLHFQMVIHQRASHCVEPRNALALVPDSHIVAVTNAEGKTHKYVRLSDSEHAQAVDTIKRLHSLREHLKPVYDLHTGLWGSRNRRHQTYGEVIMGLHEKCLRPHPIHRARIGEDFGIKQLNVLNDLIDALNAVRGEGEQQFERVAIPFEK